MSGTVFAAKKPYTVKVTLTAAAGYTFDGVAANAFTHDNASGSPVAANITATTLDVTVTFPATGAATVTDLNLTLYIPKPVTGKPASGAFAKEAVQYKPDDAGVKWYTSEGNTLFTSNFAADTAYTAVVTLEPSAADAWTFDGLGENSFTHDDTPSVSYAPATYTVTVIFPKTAEKSTVTAGTAYW
jgi:hypothetical protein